MDRWGGKQRWTEIEVNRFGFAQVHCNNVFPLQLAHQKSRMPLEVQRLKKERRARRKKMNQEERQDFVQFMIKQAEFNEFAGAVMPHLPPPTIPKKKRKKKRRARPETTQFSTTLPSLNHSRQVPEKDEDPERVRKAPDAQFTTSSLPLQEKLRSLIPKGVKFSESDFDLLASIMAPQRQESLPNIHKRHDG